MKELIVSHRTYSVERRLEFLKRLQVLIKKNESRILEALKKDLRKPPFDAYVSEVAYCLSEIKYFVKNIDKLSRDKKVGTPLMLFPSKGLVRFEPKGTVLIIAPWNYPFQLLFSPMAGAIAAGNSVVLKPSEHAPHTANLIKALIEEFFKEKEIQVVLGGVTEASDLLEMKFDHIFFTGSSAIGKIVMEKAAKHLTPVTLELGGKSPCVIFGKNSLKSVAKKIVWGKFFNTGQTCVAPDYVLIHSEEREEFQKYLVDYITKFYGRDPSTSKQYGRIINKDHLKRLTNLISEEEVLFGGSYKEEDLYLAPTILLATSDSASMKEEVFGPILPVVEVESFGEAIEFIKERDKPLAAYLFSEDEEKSQRFQEEISSGGMCINDTIIHLACDGLPFGGVGNSGMGMGHGEYSFKDFSHQKGVLIRKTWADPPIRYPNFSFSWLKKLIFKLLNF